MILIVADDLGYGDLAPYGQLRIQTPNIARMATQALLFTDFYSGSPVCAPARCTLMLGHDTGSCSARGNFQMPLRGADETLAEMLKQNGYTTGLFGKWALGDADTDSNPTAQGFDYTFGWLDQIAAHASYPKTLWSSGGALLSDGLPKAGTALAKIEMRGQYAPDLVLDQAIAFLEQAGDEPLFLYYPTTIPHANNKGASRATAFLEVPSVGAYAAQPWADGERKYAALVTKFDDHVERLHQAAMALDRPTVIIITSDNGPHDLGGSNVAFFGSAGPFRGGKGELTEGGIRVPLLIWGLGDNPRVDERPAYFPDLTATILALVGAPAREAMDGRDLLAGDAQVNAERPLYWEYHGGSGGQWAVRKGRWKTMAELSTPLQRALGTIMRLGAPRHQLEPAVMLYDLTADPGETNNLAAAHPEIVAEHFAIAEAASESPGIERDFNLFRTREGITKWVFARFVGVSALLLAVLLGLAVFWRRRRRRSRAMAPPAIG